VKLPLPPDGAVNVKGPELVDPMGSDEFDGFAATTTADVS
jgi:hypothetical protein